MSKVNKISSVIFIVIFLGMVLIAILFSSIFGNSTVADESNEYEITNYNYVATYKQDGTMQVTESISVYYKTTKHGIYRALPETSKMKLYNADGSVKFDKNLRLKYDIQSATQPYAYESTNNILYVRFGSENSYYHYGDSATYTLTYKINIDERYAPLDVFYFNILGNLWTTNVDDYQGTINFEQAITNPNTKIYCGEAGSTTTIETYSWSADKKTLTVTASDLKKGEGITVLADLPTGYATVTPNHTTNLIMLFANLVTALIVFLCFWKNSNKHQIVPVVQFSVDKKYTSADVGYIIDQKVDSEDIASLIIYWAEKGYLKIIEENKVTYLQKTDKTFKGKTYEQQMFNGIFEGKTSKDKVDIKKIGVSIADEVAVTKKAIALENENIFSKKAVGWRTFFIILVGIIQGITLATVNYKNVNDTLMFVGIAIGIADIIALLSLSAKADKKYTMNKKSKVWCVIGLVVFLAINLVVSILSFDAYCDKYLTVFVSFALLLFTCYIIWKFNVRSDEGCEELGDIIGLKNFIEVAEKERLKMLVNDDPEAFYKIMPYAYVLGVYDTWCKKFESIDVGKPSFYYSDEDVVFSAIYFSSVMRITTHSILSSINTANMKNAMDSMSSHSGGSGGGGFSGGGIGGGGIGGGGGGSW